MKKNAILFLLTAFSITSYGQHMHQTSTEYDGDIYHTGGNLGIGVSSPTGILHLKENVASAIGPVLKLQNDRYSSSSGAGSSIMFFGYSEARKSTIDAYMHGNGQANRIEFNFENSGATSNPLTLKHDGNVGIGTNNPSVLLSLKQSANKFINLDRTENANVDDQFNIGVSYSGTNDEFVFIGKADQIDDFVVTDDGNIGIGTTTPEAKLHVVGDILLEKDGMPSTLTVQSNASASVNLHNTGSGGGNFSMNAGAFNNGFTITNNDGSGAPSFNIKPSGQVIIGDGTTTPIGNDLNCKLAVDGQIVSKSSRVQVYEWSDFVFEDNYELAPLSEVEKYIIKENHLPNVPSEKEVKENGNDLGQMDAILLRKIEELTLYVIELEKKLTAIEK